MPVTRAKEPCWNAPTGHIAEAPWWGVPADDKKKAQLNCIHHLLGQFPYHEIEWPEVHLPKRMRHPVLPELIGPSVY